MKIHMRYENREWEESGCTLFDVKRLLSECLSSEVLEVTIEKEPCDESVSVPRIRGNMFSQWK